MTRALVPVVGSRNRISGSSHWETSNGEYGSFYRKRRAREVFRQDVDEPSVTVEEVPIRDEVLVVNPAEQVRPISLLVSSLAGKRSRRNLVTDFNNDNSLFEKLRLQKKDIVQVSRKPSRSVLFCSFPAHVKILQSIAGNRQSHFIIE
jgi:hypothetical protein